ncbi:hypothetical protein K474DRAFT_1591683 [Panus rudis PR-1116 ss-1]|nr:hypothetical protein K474DRAFT_1591683 [Panus rudis PR-1116 ss-1]
MRIPLILLSLASLLWSALSFDLKGRVVWNTICPNIGELGQARAILDDGKYYGGITQSGSFVIPGVPEGIYILSIEAHDHVFDRLRVDVHDASSETLPEIRPLLAGTPLSTPAQVTLPYPILLHARGKYDYYVPKESFNLLGMFKNPMMMLMLFTGIMMLAMPYIMKNMDPEALADFQERQAKIGSIQSSIQSGDFKSG